METSLDRSGRVLIPKALRARAAWAPGTALEARVEDGRIILEPRAEPVRLTKRGRFVVAEPEDDRGPLAADAVDDALDTLRSRGSGG